MIHKHTITNSKLVNKLSSLSPIIVAAVIGFMSSMAVAEEYVAKLSYHWNNEHHSGIHTKMFADEVNRRAAGRLRIDLFPSGQLFGVREIMGAVSAGSVQMGGILGVVSLPAIDKNYNVAVFPGMFDSYQQKRDYFANAESGQQVWNNILAKTKTTVLMYNPVGPVMTFSSERKLDSVAAMKGLKARALFKSERPRWKALGAKAISLPTREVYTSLQTGMIDTINSPPIGVKAYSWWEFVKYAQLPYQSFADAYIMVNNDWYNQLPKDLQQLLLEVGRDVGKISTDKIMQTAEDILVEFEQRGGVISRIEGQAQADFDAIMKEKVLPNMSELIDADVLAGARTFTNQ